jgi:hypothetical protein
LSHISKQPEIEPLASGNFVALTVGNGGIVQVVVTVGRLEKACDDPEGGETTGVLTVVTGGSDTEGVV